ncbi:alpha/beta fold hydrolase [Microbacterium sp.]|uniref:alpha/beta fold hydrolase n=1 Tax=Microbacterium sp. TaxID=51671 RepID=UPI003C7913A5
MPAFTTQTGVEIYYETNGDPSDRPLVLVHGSGAQLIGWDDEFVAQLVDAGFYVVRPDNRDVGLSQMTAERRDLTATYDLSDMAEDVVALLDELGIARAHLAGMSMGGYIIQLVAISHPDRVASLALMSTSASSAPEFLASAPGDGKPVEKVPRLFGRAAYIAMFVAGQRQLASPGFAFDAKESAALGARYYKRSFRPDGVARQWNALLRGPLERREALGAVTAPAIVIHGLQDPVLLPYAAATLAEILPAAELQLYPEMGHDVPRELWPDFVRAFVRVADRAAAADAVDGGEDDPSHA